jgi:hypothetical protein
MEKIHMPLTRLNDGYAVDLEGISFGMREQRLDEQRLTVRCLVTGDALTDAMGGNPSQEEQVQWFVANRAEIEAVASSMFDGGANTQPQLRVGTRDLNPHLFK